MHVHSIPTRLFSGIAFALAAGMLWGIVFVGPVLLPEYPAASLAFGRYIAFGLIALALLRVDRRELARLSRSDWIEALKLAAVGNLIYYLFLASAIRHAGAPLPTVIIGALPVVIALVANRRDARRDGRLPWRRLVLALLLIGAGIASVNHDELKRLEEIGGTLRDHGMGALLAAGALICWTWYPLRNADWLRAHPDRNPRAWATAQGLATLPLALAGFALWGLYESQQSGGFSLPVGPRPAAYLGLMLTIGLGASWLGTLCWNAASQRLPTAILGQLIVFETLSALAYAFVLRGESPPPASWLGAALLLAGVIFGAGAKAKPAAP